MNEWLYSLILNNVVQLQNQRQLMRHLCTTAVSCYYKQSRFYKEKENNGMVNLYISDALEALNNATLFI